MRWSTSTKRLLLLAALWTAVAGTGCSPLRVPRIDPTGQRIFAQDTVPVTCNFGCLNQQPAFQQPPPVSPCPAPGVTTLTPLPEPPKDLADPEALQLSPARVVAPVGTEVVLVAGLNRKRHLHEAGRPVNWILSRESVGYITEVGKDYNYFDLVSNRDYGIQGPDFATSSTLMCDKTIDRGTDLPGDDVRVLRGQTWMSVSSASPGLSRVTALAPTFDNWPARQQTATIYWVDAQWQFPAPVVVPAGEKAVLSTTVLRQTNRQPVEGWQVLYEVLDGPQSAFLVNGQPAQQGAPIKVQTDSNGFATAELAPLTGEAGTAQVRVTIIQPNMDPQSNAENLTLGSGVMTVTWSAPQLDLTMTGPQVANFQEQAVYNINIENRGDVAARDTRVVMDMPPGLSYVSSVPAASEYGNQLEWNIGDLEARGYRQIQVTTQIVQSGIIEPSATARAQPNLQSSGSVRTQVQVDAIQLSVQGPGEVIVGEDAVFNITIRNASDRRLTGLRLVDEYDGNGLVHEFRGRAGSVENEQFTELGPGMETTIPLRFSTENPGRFWNRVTITSEDPSVGGKQVTDWVTVSPPPAEPTFTLDFEGAPPQSQVGELILFRAHLVNTGPVALTNVRIEQVVDPSLQMLGFTEPAQQIQNGASWTFPNIPPNSEAFLEIQCRSTQVAQRVGSTIRLVADGGISRSQDVFVDIVPRQAPTTEPSPGIGQGNSSQPQVSGNLKVSLTDLDDNVAVGSRIRYLLRITNDRNVEDANVRVQLQLSPGLKFTGVNLNPNERPTVSPDGKTVQLPPFRGMRIGEVIELRIETEAIAAGQQGMRVDAVSERTPQAVFSTAETTVF